MLATSPLRVYMVFLVAGVLILPGLAMAQHGEVDPVPGDAAQPVPAPPGGDPEPNDTPDEAVPISLGPDSWLIPYQGQRLRVCRHLPT